MNLDVAYCMMGFNSLYEIKPYIETALPFIDRFIFIDGGSSDGTVEYLKFLDSDKIEIYIHQWKDDFAGQRNNYLKHFAEKQKDGWILVSDTDEHFPIETLSRIRDLIQSAESEGYTGIKFLAYDIIVADNDHDKIISEYVSQSNFHKPLLFKYNPSIYYEGGAHEVLLGDIKWTEVELIYRHIRSQQKIYDRAVQNFWVWSNVLSLPKWSEFKNLCTQNNITKFKDYYNIYKQAKLPENLETWLYNHRNFDDGSKGLDILELGDMTRLYPFKRGNEIFISTYISTYNGLFYQSTLEQTIRQSLLFSDEVVIVGSEHSTDGSNELLDDMKAENKKIKTYLFSEKPCQETLAEKKTFALRKCTGDYCILQDDDEMIHEKHIQTIRRLPEVFPETMVFRFDVIHFYRSFKHYQIGENWYPRKIYMIKNLKEIRHGKVNRDRDNYLINDIPLDSLPYPQIINAPVTVYHYGWCRHDAVMQMKKYFQEKQWWGDDYWKTHDFPLKFEYPKNLPEFTGTHPIHMIPVIESENRLKMRHIKEFSEEGPLRN